MRIITFSTNYLPHIGGAELAIKEITDRLEAVEFTLITARLNRSRQLREEIGNVTVYRIGIGHRIDVFLLAVFGWIKALWLHTQTGFDLAWGMMASQGSIAGAVFARLTGCPFVLTVQEGDEEEHLKRYVGGNDFLYKLLIRPLHYLPFRTADHTTTISNYLKKRAKQVVSDTPVTIIPNGVDLKAFDREFDSKTIQSLRSQYAGADDVLVVTTSRLAKKNAVGDLIQSLTQLPDRYRLLVLGEGDLEAKLRKQVKEQGLTDRVFMPGSVDFEAVPKYLQTADVFCRPSLSEGMGSSFIEAMAAEVPVVATPVGGIVDFLEHEKTGLFAEVENPESVATQIRRLRENTDLRSTIIKNAYTMVTERYNWDSIAKKYRETFSKLTFSSR